MKRNNFFSRFIVVTLTAALLLMSGSRAIPVSALAVGPLADPVYDTEIIAFKDYVEQNLDAPQLDIMFFLIGGLAVAQMGAQDAMLISPYPNEENVKQWIINCGIQLYNSVIGLVPEGDYYMGIPSISTAGTKGVPRQVIKGLVAQMMGDAVVAINYPDLDTFFEENPNELYLPFNADLQLGVNAIFGLNGGLNNWQTKTNNIGELQNFSWFIDGLSQESIAIILNHVGIEGIRFNMPSPNQALRFRGIYGYNTNYNFKSTYHNIFINTYNHTVSLYSDAGNQYNELTNMNLFGLYAPYAGRIILSPNDVYGSSLTLNSTDYKYTYDSSATTVKSIILAYIDHLENDINNHPYPALEDFIQHIYMGTDWNGRQEVYLTDDLNIQVSNENYYMQVTQDYLFDLRGLMGDLVNYVYTHNPVWDNIYDPDGTLVIPDTISVSVDLTPITDLLAPPVPVNLNDIAEYTDNTYFERVKEHARNAGDIFANYVAFWHNCDSDLVYTVFGAAILVLVGAFVGKWGHS